MKHAAVSTFLLGALLAVPFGAAPAAPLADGVFIQPNRELAAKSPDDWRALAARIREAGFREVYLQWTAEPGLAYFESDRLDAPEQYPLVERLLEAAETNGLRVVLGLDHDPGFWTHITAPPTPLRDYFLLRAARHDQVHQALLQRFAGRTAWTGCYVPDELDDLSWRAPGPSGLVRDYLALLGGRLRTNDASRALSISAFFRERTAPAVFAANLGDLLAGAGLDAVLLQDGQGAADPAAAFLPLYLQAVRAAFPGDRPRLVLVLEAFRQISREGQPFQAVPAAPDAFRPQALAGKDLIPRRVVFSFPEYLDPDAGPAAARLHEFFRKGNAPLP